LYNPQIFPGNWKPNCVAPLNVDPRLLQNYLQKGPSDGPDILRNVQGPTVAKIPEEINFEKVGPLLRVEPRTGLNIRNGHEFAKVDP